MLLNYMPCKSPQYNSSPHQLFYGTPPDVHRLRRFGCHCVAWMPVEDRINRDKIADPAGRQVRYIGAPKNNIRSYLVYDPATRRVSMASSVRFSEHLPTPAPRLELCDLINDHGHPHQRSAVEYLQQLHSFFGGKPFDPSSPPWASHPEDTAINSDDTDIESDDTADDESDTNNVNDPSTTLEEGMTSGRPSSARREPTQDDSGGKSDDTSTAEAAEAEDKPATGDIDSDDNLHDREIDENDGWHGQYRVIKPKGESYISIARQLGIDAKELASMNIPPSRATPHRTKARLKRGTTLWIPTEKGQVNIIITETSAGPSSAGHVHSAQDNAECKREDGPVPHDMSRRVYKRVQAPVPHETVTVDPQLLQDCHDAMCSAVKHHVTALTLNSLDSIDDEFYRQGLGAWMTAGLAVEQAIRELPGGRAHLVTDLPPGIKQRDIPQPRNYKEAMRSDYRQWWISAIQKEIGNLNDHGVLRWVRRDSVPRNVKPIDYTWAFKAKPNNDGDVDKFKARLCARGFREIYGIHYTETHAPVTTLAAFRASMADAAHHGHHIDIFDIGSAYLRSVLLEDVYFYPIDGFEHPYGERKEWLQKADRAIYGLKQAGRSWGKDLNRILIELGMSRCSSEPCMYVGHFNSKGEPCKAPNKGWAGETSARPSTARHGPNMSSSSFIRLNTHVDDCCCVFNNTEVYNKFKGELEARLKAASNSDQPVLSQSDDNDVYLGITVERVGKNTIKLCQARYVDDILNAFRMYDCKPRRTPFVSGIKLSKDLEAKTKEDYVFMKGKEMRKLVGMLLHLQRCTRPDISAAVVTLARFQVNPGPAHWNWGMNILKYLKGTRDHGIIYGEANINNKDHVQYVPLTMYHDSDWGGDIDDRKSQTGWVSFSYGGPINWTSTKQQCVAQSSCEAEYIAANEACKESIWSIRLLEDLGYTAGQLRAAQHSSHLSNNEFRTAHYLRDFPNEQEKAGATPLTQFCDSTAAISNTINTGRDHRRMKHIEIRYHYVRNQVQAGRIRVAKVHTDNNVSDILTKSIKIEAFTRHRDSLVRELLPGI